MSRLEEIREELAQIKKTARPEVAEEIDWALNSLASAIEWEKVPEGETLCPECGGQHKELIPDCPHCGYDRTR